MCRDGEAHQRAAAAEVGNRLVDLRQDHDDRSLVDARARRHPFGDLVELDRLAEHQAGAVYADGVDDACQDGFSFG